MKKTNGLLIAIIVMISVFIYFYLDNLTKQRYKEDCDRFETLRPETQLFYLQNDLEPKKGWINLIK
jgi:hypothetical protein